MKRVAEMLAYLKDDMEQELERWKQLYFNADDSQVKEAINSLRTKIEADDASIVISYLRSSYITEKHLFKVTIYENEPFINEPTLYKLVDLTPLYKQIPEKIDKYSRKIRSKFIRVLPYEVEEIRRFYMERLYKDSWIFFEKAISKTEVDDGRIPVYFGEELGSIKKIGGIE